MILVGAVTDERRNNVPYRFVVGLAKGGLPLGFFEVFDGPGSLL